jgi:anhydro-N-acetylmuramic acid kinase
VRRHAGTAKELLVCGGGAFNADLMARLGALLGPMAVVSSADRGLPPDQVEACAFAWLARAFIQGQPGNIPTVTGAAGPRILGALYPGRGAPRT